MVTRRGMLALVSAMCVLASASANAAGEFEAAMKAALVSLLSDKYDEGFPDAAAERSANVAAECLTSYAIEGFSSEELRELDAASSEWGTLSKPTRMRVFERMFDPEAMRSCGFAP